MQMLLIHLPPFFLLTIQLSFQLCLKQWLTESPQREKRKRMRGREGKREVEEKLFLTEECWLINVSKFISGCLSYWWKGCQRRKSHGLTSPPLRGLINLKGNQCTWPAGKADGHHLTQRSNLALPAVAQAGFTRRTPPVWCSRRRGAIWVASQKHIR